MTFRPWLLHWNAEVPDRGAFAQVCYAVASQLRELPEMPSAAELLEAMGEYTAVHLAQVYKNLDFEMDLAEVDWVVFADAIRAAGGLLSED
jgi:hypothetical protein